MLHLASMHVHTQLYGAMSISLFDDPDGLARPEVVKTALPNGGFVLRSPQVLQPYARCVTEWIDLWAELTPDTVAIAERGPDGEWRRLSYRELFHAVGSVAQGLLDLSLEPEAPVVVLSDNAIDHALLMLAAMHVGRPVCTVSSAYSRVAKDFSKLHGILAALRPALVYASDARLYGAALKGANIGAAPLVFSEGSEEVPGSIAFSSLLSTDERLDVIGAFLSVRPDHHAKYLLTSGSTGVPKVVINTHRMLCANQQQIAQTWRFLSEHRPVILDWLPWSHTFGGNHNLNLSLRNGGSLYIDDGRPAPGMVEKTVRNIRDVRPTLYFNVPRGYDMLLPALEADTQLAHDLFSRLKLAFYAGAALPQASWDRLQTVAAKVRDEPVWFTTSWGATETAPAVTSAHWRTERAGVIGLPMPGVDLKFVPNGEKLEMRVRGVTVFPGYRDAPALTQAAFDEEGFYCIGDAGLLAEADRPEAGVVFNGRVAEDFKLTTGTWVSVGTLRLRLLSALAPLAQDAVITGHDRDEVGALLFPSAHALSLTEAERAERSAAALHALLAEGGGSSQSPKRLMWLTEPPQADAGEITDKGYINQRAVLQRRTAEVETLYATPTSPRVITVG
jgi:feruloyl-CoA synthase